jgi:hypothetical protein
MTEEDLDRIEQALDIALPDAYRAALLNFPIVAWRGNTETELWDDADAIIELNRELRAGAPGGVPPWPAHMFALGHSGDGSPSALDLSTPGAPRWWVDRSGLANVGSGQTHASFEEWLPEYLEDLRHDLLMEGLDPNSTPREREAAMEKNDQAGAGCFWAGVGLGLLIVVISIVVKWVF